VRSKLKEPGRVRPADRWRSRVAHDAPTQKKSRAMLDASRFLAGNFRSCAAAQGNVAASVSEWTNMTPLAHARGYVRTLACSSTPSPFPDNFVRFADCSATLARCAPRTARTLCASRRIDESELDPCRRGALTPREQTCATTRGVRAPRLQQGSESRAATVLATRLFRPYHPPRQQEPLDSTRCTK
jgi:hypothetical protein